MFWMVSNMHKLSIGFISLISACSVSDYTGLGRVPQLTHYDQTSTVRVDVANPLANSIVVNLDCGCYEPKVDVPAHSVRRILVPYCSKTDGYEVAPPTVCTIRNWSIIPNLKD